MKQLPCVNLADYFYGKAHCLKRLRNVKYFLDYSSL